MMKREEVIEKLNEIEKKYKPINWEVNGVYFWPFLKTFLFFENQKPPIDDNFLKNVIKKCARRLLTEFGKLSSIIIGKKKISSIRLPNAFAVFGSPHTVRADFAGESFSRYFDPLMDQIEIDNKSSVLFEYLKPSSYHSYKRSRIINLADWYPFFKKMKSNRDLVLSSLDNYSYVMNEVAAELEIDFLGIERKFKKNFEDVLIWQSIWTYIMRQTKAKVAFVICYYSNQGFGMTLAARKLGIPIVDMQHGGQGKLHPCYFFNSPNFIHTNLIPNFFWEWEIASAKNIQNWLIEEDQSRALIGGNTWIDFLASRNDEYLKNYKSDIFLYTLQTTIYPLVPNFLLSAIKESPDNIKWWFRLHPRMTNIEIDDLRSFIAKENIGDKIEMEYASRLPLPLVLKYSKIHISASSGSIGEAALVGVGINIIISSVGRENYQDLIDTGLATYFNGATGESFANFISLQLNNRLIKQELGTFNMYRQLPVGSVIEMILNFSS